MMEKKDHIQGMRFNVPARTNADVIKDALEDGPLDDVELTRRAKIAVFNIININFEQIIEDLERFPGQHPETRQIEGQMAKVLMDLADSLDVNGGRSVQEPEEIENNKENN